MIVGTAPVKVGHRQTPIRFLRSARETTKPPPTKRGFFIAQNKPQHYENTVATVGVNIYLLNKIKLLILIYNFSCICRPDLEGYVSGVDFSTITQLVFKGKNMKKLIGGMLVLAGLIAFPAWAAVNINTASQSELEAVKGLGPAKAKAIITYRESTKGGFKSLDELDNVKGFGKASIEKLKEDLSVGTEKAKP